MSPRPPACAAAADEKGDRADDDEAEGHQPGIREAEDDEAHDERPRSPERQVLGVRRRAVRVGSMVSSVDPDREARGHE